jgi:DnaJ-domain-containing protein 1
MFFLYLALGFLLLVGTAGALRLFATADPAKLAKAVKWIAAIAGVIGILLLAMRLPFGVSMTLLAFAVPLLWRWQAQRRRARAASGPSGGQRSQVQTAYLRMELDHDSGTLDGLVLDGNLRGRRLGELPLDVLLELRAECALSDPESVPLLEAYLDRTHGAEWRRGRAQAGPESAPTSPPSAAMTRAEALQILGLEDGADEAAIRAAYHRLMKKLHPDQGGSDYLAAKINQARDFLLG